MPSTQQSKIIKAPIDQVWGKLSNFHELPWAAEILPSVEKVGEKNAHEVGAKRILNDAFHETLTRFEPENFRLEYSIDDGPSPVSKKEVSNYVGVIQMSPMVEGDVTLVAWNSSWKSNSEDAVEFCHGIYIALLDALEKSFN
jgi:hypothetical protein